MESRNRDLVTPPREEEVEIAKPELYNIRS